MKHTGGKYQRVLLGLDGVLATGAHTIFCQLARSVNMDKYVMRTSMIFMSRVNFIHVFLPVSGCFLKPTELRNGRCHLVGVDL